MESRPASSFSLRRAFECILSLNLTKVGGKKKRISSSVISNVEGKWKGDGGAEVRVRGGDRGGHLFISQSKPIVFMIARFHR